jgi:hypothetical protein
MHLIFVLDIFEKGKGKKGEKKKDLYGYLKLLKMSR